MISLADYLTLLDRFWKVCRRRSSDRLCRNSFLLYSYAKNYIKLTLSAVLSEIVLGNRSPTLTYIACSSQPYLTDVPSLYMTSELLDGTTSPTSPRRPISHLVLYRLLANILQSLFQKAFSSIKPPSLVRIVCSFHDEGTKTREPRPWRRSHARSFSVLRVE